MEEKFFCKKCGKELRSKHAKCFACSDNVRKSVEKYKDKSKDEYIICPLCGLHGADLTHHAWYCHGMRKDEYLSKTDLPFIKCKKLCDVFRGSNNPGYNHGGKFSPFSKKSGRTSEQIKTSMEKANRGAAKNSIRTIGYWMNKGCNEEEAGEMVSWFQTRNLDWFIHYYGEEDGLRRYNRKRERWLKTMNAKSEEEMLDINRRKCSSGSGVSKLEINFTKRLEKNGILVETQFPLKSGTKTHVYDMRIGNTLVEINGDLWHMNPEIYEPTDKNPVTGVEASEKWAKDKRKIEDGIAHGYDVITIWESDLKRDYDKYIDMCVNFAREESNVIPKTS